MNNTARKRPWAWVLAVALVLVAAQSMTFGARVAPTAVAGHSFSYSGDEGPGFWASLDPAWANCARTQNRRQSPINITRTTLDGQLKPLDLQLRRTPIRLVNNGHTVELEYARGSSIRWHAVTYGLEQVHFHTTSEHTVHAHRYPMELHAVFQNAATGKIVVIAQLYRLGAKNAFLDTFDHLLPVKSGDHASSTAAVNLANGLTSTSHYWTYRGSLTTPPCSPVVTWVVLKRVATMSDFQLRREFWRIMGDNFRPIQDRNARVIKSTP